MLQQMESHLHESDPHLAKFGKDTLYAHCLRRMKLATVTFLAGTMVLVVALATATTFVVAFIGFVIMLASALWFERALPKLGRAGLQQLAQAHREDPLVGRPEEADITETVAGDIEPAPTMSDTAEHLKQRA